MDFKQGKGYLVKWAGFSNESDWTWQRGSDFLGEEAKQMIKDYRNVKKVKEYHADWVLKTKEGTRSGRGKQFKSFEESAGKSK